MKIEKPRQLLTDDFSTEEKPLVERLADIINPALENLYRITDGNTTFENTTWGLITGVIVKVSSTGSLDSESGANRVITKFKNPAKASPVGIVVLSATCIDDPSIYPTSTPFISYSVDNNLIQLKNIQGLPAGKRFQLALMVITN